MLLTFTLQKLTFIPIIFLSIGYYLLIDFPKFLILVVIAMTFALFAVSPNRLILRLSSLWYLYILVFLVLIGAISLLDSQYFSTASFVLGVQYFLFSIFFILVYSSVAIDLEYSAKLFQKVIVWSFVVFILDTIVKYLNSDVFIFDGILPRFSPSLGASAGSIYLLSILIPLLNLPAVYGKKFHMVLNALVISLILLTLTRISLLALMLIFFYKTLGVLGDRSKRVAKKTALIVFSISMAVVGFWLILNRLYFEGAEASIEAINTNGRLFIWENFIREGFSKPLIGHGWGASSVFIMDSDLNIGFGIQPHNDYLRILFETGFVGFFLFLVSLLMLWRMINNSYAIHRNKSFRATSHMYLIVFGVLMLTDNVILYHFYTYTALSFICMSICATTDLKRNDLRTIP
ncbi:MAG: O-antigen ligase family protein [Pseudohongiella sp.]|nr:O-antigen ligase family protein [Pseudohongiella sp.]